jgi:hypothetical protein
MSERSDCDLLRPSLVAFVYDEPHPETPRLMAHLEACTDCRREEEELRGTRDWLELSLDSTTPFSGVLGGAEGQRSRPARVVSFLGSVLAGVAVVALACILLWTADNPGGPASDKWRDLTDSGGSQGVLSFDGRDLDERLERIGTEIEAFSTLGGVSW